MPSWCSFLYVSKSGRQQWPQVWKMSILIPIPKKFSSVPVMSDSLWPHEPQHTKPPYPSPTARVYPNPCPLSRCCHPTILSSVIPLSFRPQSFPESGSSHQVAKVLELQLQHQSFQWTPRTDLQDGLIGSPCSTKDSQESSPTSQFKSINSSVLGFLYTPTLTSIYGHWKNHSLDWTDLCWQTNVSAF